MESMHVFITGGAGFIGSHSAEALLEAGAQVTVYDNFSTGKRENLPAREGLSVVRGDIRDAGALSAAMAGVTHVLHLAAQVSVRVSIEDPPGSCAHNVLGFVNVLEAARKAGVRRVAFASSAAVYGMPRRLPLDEEAPLAPISPYGLEKRIDELYGVLYGELYGLSTVALRYFNVYGPRQRPDSDYAAAIPIFLRRLLAGQPLVIFGDGKQTRDFIFVKDVVRANLLAAESSAAGEAFNICTGHETSLLDLLEELSELAPGRQERISPEVRFEAPRPGDIFRSFGSPEKASAALGFQAQVRLAQGLGETVKWMKGQ